MKYTMMFKLISQRQAAVVEPATEPGKICAVDDYRQIPELMLPKATAHGTHYITSIVKDGCLKGRKTKKTEDTSTVFFYKNPSTPNIFANLKGHAKKKTITPDKRYGTAIVHKHHCAPQIPAILVFNDTVFEENEPWFGYYDDGAPDDRTRNEGSTVGTLSLHGHLAAVVLFDLTDQVFREEAKKIQAKFPTVSCYLLKKK